MNGQTFTWKIDKASHGKTLRDYLMRDLFISRQALTDIKFNGGALKVNEVEVTVRYVLKEGDFLKVRFPEEKVSESLHPVEMPLTILYEDDHFILVDKPFELPTIPSKFRNEESLAQGILHYYKKNGIGSTIHAVNRLDRNTSGIVMFAKHRYGHSLLSRQQRDRSLERTYVAFCQGIPGQGEGVIDVPIGRKEGSIIERCVRPDGQAAKTRFRILGAFETCALVQLKLETGRTHQIRVHMASIGHALLGDDLYGGSLEYIKRQALHSHTLEFFHPFDQKWVHIEAPLPPDLIQLRNRLQQ